MNISCLCGISIGIISNGATIDDSPIHISCVRMGLVKHIQEGFSSSANLIAGEYSTLRDIIPPESAKTRYHKYQVIDFPPNFLFRYGILYPD